MFLGYKHLTIGNKTEYHELISNNDCQLLLLWDMQRWNTKNHSKSTLFVTFLVLSVPFNKTTKPTKPLLLNCTRLLKLRTLVLSSAAWFWEKWACSNHEGKALRTKHYKSDQVTRDSCKNCLQTSKKNIAYFSCILRDCLFILTEWVRNYYSY